METKNKFIHLKILYIFFIFLTLSIFFFSTAKVEGKAFDISNIEISRPFEINFDKNKVLDDGFKKAYLVGCDYFFNPPINGHFWDNEKPRYNITNYDPNELMSIIKNSIDLSCITIKGIDSKINDIQYEDMFNVKESYRESNELISGKNLAFLNKTKYTRL